MAISVPQNEAVERRIMRQTALFSAQKIRRHFRDGEQFCNNAYGKVSWMVCKDTAALLVVYKVTEGE